MDGAGFLDKTVRESLVVGKIIQCSPKPISILFEKPIPAFFVVFVMVVVRFSYYY